MPNSYDLSKSIPNKLLNEDDTITDLLGNEVSNQVLEYKNRPAIPNKVLNPDGSYSTLDALLGKIVDTTIFIVVDTLPEEGEKNRIYLVPGQNGMFDEYFWNENGKWDKIGEVNIDLSNYPTFDQMNSAIDTAIFGALGGNY